jgi:signal transduction histidine kinase
MATRRMMVNGCAPRVGLSVASREKQSVNKPKRQNPSSLFQQSPGNPSGPAQLQVDYRLLFENALEQMILLAPVFDEEGRLIDSIIHDVNPSFEQATGLQRGTIRGRLSSEVFLAGPEAPLWLADMRSAVESVTRGEPSSSGEVFFEPADRHFLFEIFPLNDGLLAVISVDITQQKRAVEALRENQDRLTLSEEHAAQRKAQIEVQHRMLETREDERQRIATHLHEGLLQALIGVRYAIEEGLSIEQKEIRLARLAAVQATLQREIQGLRDYYNELRPPTLNLFGLEKTIRAYVERYQKKNSAPQVELLLAPDHQRLPDRTRLVLYRAFQELFSSAVARPGVDRVQVVLRLSDDAVTLEVNDNSAGEAIPLRWVDLARQGQLGLASALEQVEGAGGHMVFASTPGAGAHVRVNLPLKV